MIRLPPKPQIPSTLTTSKITAALSKIRSKIENGQEIKAKDFPSHWLEDDVRLALWRYQHKKCCYCERIRDPKREPDVEHFRPKTEVDGVGKPGYWWLAYDWSNLFFSCKKCNQTKLAQFPMVEGAHVRTPSGNVSTEKPVLPHPVDDNPEDFISFRWEFEPLPIAVPIGKDNLHRGERSITILGLDDGDIAEQRGRLLLTLKAVAAKMMAAEHLMDKSQIKRAKREIMEATKAANEFAGFRRAFFRAEGLGEYVATDM